LSKSETKPGPEGDDFGTCYEAALHYIEYRPRSGAEVSRHLQYKRKFSEESVSRVIAKLKELQLIDDRAFSESWARERVSHRHKSSLMIRHELMQKGVDSVIIESVTGGIDDEANALRAGVSKARQLGKLEYPEFYKRLASYLSRKGFGAELVQRVVKRLWDGRMDDTAVK
jgi:regulatory protein